MTSKRGQSRQLALLIEARELQKMVRRMIISKDGIIPEKKHVARWIMKHPITAEMRLHLFQILEDILSRPKERVLDQGAAEGIVCKLLQNRGYEVLAVDIDPLFLNCWKKLSIEGKIADCTSNDWWDRRKFDTIIAGVWVACKGSKKRITNSRKRDLERIRDNWVEILRDGGVVYFDVNVNKYPITPLMQIFKTKFKIEQFSKKPRCVLKCTKK